MKAYELQKAGLEGLAQTKRTLLAPAPGEVQIKVKAASLNYRDLKVAQGGYRKFDYPLVPVSDGVGEVIAIGEGVTRFAVGDRVATHFHPHWFSNARPSAAETAQTLGGQLDGILTEKANLAADWLVKVPGYLTDEEAATLPIAALTAWTTLVEDGGLRAGETVLVEGSGGVSIFAIQFASLFGARVIAISSSDEKLARARELGAAHTINYRSHPDWDDEVLRLTKGEGVDHVVEVAGGTTLSKALKALKSGGQIGVIGFLDGMKTELDLVTVIAKRARIRGVLVGSRDSFERMNKFLARHEVRPVIDTVFEFDQLREAFEHLASGKHFGKIAIRVAA
jgi:NADPH:quinone reductase-like Zn-dependent oxidoreductase